MKLTDAQKTEHAQLVSELDDAKDNLTNQIDIFNRAQKDEWNDVDRALRNLENVIESCNDFKESICKEVSDAVDEAEENSDEEKELNAWLDSFEEEVYLPELNKPEKLEIDSSDLDFSAFVDMPLEQ